MRNIFLFLLLILADPCLAEPPRVLVSIKPLHALTAEIMTQVGIPDLLLKGGNTPHSYALRPSDARRIADADLIIWVGPELEGFLLKPLQNLNTNARVLTLLQQPSLIRLPQRSGGFWDSDFDQHDSKREENSSNQNKHFFNPHLWLDPLNAQKIVQLIAAELIKLDPENRTSYQKQADQLIEKLGKLHVTLQARLVGLKGIPYLVFHDAFHYLENRYQLSAVGSVTVSPDRLPGARRIIEISKKIERSGAKCIFSEPQFTPKLVEVLHNETGIKSGTLDPLGADLPEGQNSYFQILNNLADGLNNCLVKQ